MLDVNTIMSIVKYLIMIYLLGAMISIIRFIITPIEETITIQKSVFWLLITWAIFGLTYMTIIMIRILTGKGDEIGKI